MKLYTPIITITFFLLYWSMTFLSGPAASIQQKNTVEVVIAAPIQILLYFGDRFLAANVTAFRAIVSNPEHATRQYHQRAYLVASKLNPCHEDNYWIGNISLSWGGAMSQGFEVLRNATECRFWDEWPPFFYAFNQSFFAQDIEEARRSLEVAALRSPTAAPTFRTFSTMLAAGKINNPNAALKMLEKERDAATSGALKEKLNKRALRLNGLITLRQAQKLFEEKFERKLKNPEELLKKGLLEKYPEDPMGIGYEFRNNKFHLRELKFR